METICKQEYIKAPCSASSLPYWKTKNIVVPENMLILHDDMYNIDDYKDYSDEKYFRLLHDLKIVQRSSLSVGFSVVSATIEEFVDHINSCYSDISISEQYLISYREHPVYDKYLWLAVKDNSINRIVASGIAEFDPEIREGALEWIQVTKEYRGKGLGKFIVNELLYRLKERADFVTVSGKTNNETNPEILYRKCGFTGADVWHILHIK